MGVGASAHAQVQRSFINLGFELPDLGTSACVGTFVAPNQVPGWNTTHASATAGGGCGITANPANGPIMELWANSFNGTPARSGKQHAELNASQNSRVFQNICLTTDEVIGWRLSHRGRNSATVPDVMSFGINASGSTTTGVTSEIARIGTTNNGTDRTNTGGVAIPSFASQGTITIGGTSNGWRDYSGSFTYTGTSGVQQLGFAAVSSSGGITLGNFLDDIQIVLRPYVEFEATTVSTREGQPPTLPRVRIIGTVPAGGITVPVQLTGTATAGSDYTITAGTGTTANIVIPPGTYDNAFFSVPITITDDTVIENNETIIFTLQADPTNYTLTSTVSCSTAVGQTVATLTINDNDVDLRTAKTVSNATPTPGGITQFTVTFSNNTARPTIGDTTAHDAIANIADVLPAGLTFASWTCTASGGATCPVASGSGAIGASNANLPAGNGAAGGVLTYTINATLGAGQCAEITNTATISTNTPLAEGASAQAGFVTPAPGGTANNSATATVDAACVALSLTKSDSATTYTPGGQASYVIHACNAGPDTATGSTITDALANGVRLRSPWSCTGAGGGSCPAAGGVAGDSTITVAGIVLPTSACVDVLVPVNFSANPTDY